MSICIIAVNDEVVSLIRWLSVRTRADGQLVAIAAAHLGAHDVSMLARDALWHCIFGAFFRHVDRDGRFRHRLAAIFGRSRWLATAADR